MRAAVKDKRKQRKTILKNLCEHCLHAAGQAVFSAEMQKIFLQLFNCFDQCLQLINNEKLMENTITNRPVDLHSKNFTRLQPEISYLSVSSLEVFLNNHQKCMLICLIQSNHTLVTL